MGELPALGSVLNAKYEVVRVLGEGGMGCVFEARHIKLGEHVAIKTLLPELLHDPTLRARFEREARSSAQLRTPYAVKILDVDVTPEGAPFLVMERLEGRDLARVIREKTALTLAEGVHYVLQAAAAMLDAHKRGIVHRDLKPSNLFVAREGPRERIKVLDFGISKSQQYNEGLTGPGTMIGTLSYVAPEQLMSASNVDARADVWSLGVVLYELLAGRRPFRGNDAALATAILTKAPTPVSMLRPTVPKEFDAVIDRALAKDLHARFADMGEFMRALVPFGPPNATVDDYVRGVLAESVDSNRHEDTIEYQPTPSLAKVIAASEPPSTRVVPRQVIESSTQAIEPTRGTRTSRRSPLALAALGLIVGAVTAGAAFVFAHDHVRAEQNATPSAAAADAGADAR